MQSVVKEALRREIRRRKQQYTSSQLEELSESIIARLRPLLADARLILAYYSLPDEVNTHQLIDDLVAEGKTVLLPKVLDATTMELRLYTGPHDLAPGPFGILEPTGSPFHLSTFSPFPPSSEMVALIPGVAFDCPLCEQRSELQGDSPQCASLLTRPLFRLPESPLRPRRSHRHSRRSSNIIKGRALCSSLFLSPPE